jgi:competence protein ComFB
VIKINSNIVALKMKNLMEDVVYDVMDKLAEETEFCSCGICRLDMAAHALNHLPPKYVVTKMGEAYSKIDQLHQQFQVDVAMALYNAIEAVKKNPRH